MKKITKVVDQLYCYEQQNINNEKGKQRNRYRRSGVSTVGR